MRILVQGLSPSGLSHLWRAGRAWPTGEPLEVEVLDQDADPPELEVLVPNATTGGLMKEKRPDPVRIGRASYAILKKDKRLRLMSTADVDSSAANAAVQAARAEVQKLAGQLADANVEIATLKAELAASAAALEAAKAKPAPVAAAAPAPVVSPAPVVAPVATGTPPQAAASSATTAATAPGGPPSSPPKETPPAA